MTLRHARRSKFFFFAFKIAEWPVRVYIVALIFLYVMPKFIYANAGTPESLHQSADLNAHYNTQDRQTKYLFDHKLTIYINKKLSKKLVNLCAIWCYNI